LYVFARSGGHHLFHFLPTRPESALTISNLTRVRRLVIAFMCMWSILRLFHKLRVMMRSVEPDTEAKAFLCRFLKHPSSASCSNRYMPASHRKYFPVEHANRRSHGICESFALRHLTLPTQ
jgi:hypothetical protein